jgi:hypothetical protein
MGATLYELPPGEKTWPYHFERANEEWLLCVSGRPTLRTPDGERELAPGDVAVFPRGPSGAHAVHNRGDETARVVVLSTKNPVDVAEFPYSGKVGIWDGGYVHVLQKRRDRRLLGGRRLTVAAPPPLVIAAPRIFDGVHLVRGGAVRIERGRIVAVGRLAAAARDARRPAAGRDDPARARRPARAPARRPLPARPARSVRRSSAASRPSGTWASRRRGSHRRTTVRAGCAWSAPGRS